MAPVAGAYFAELPITQIVPNAVQPRQVFDEEAMAELVHSITEVGLLQPIVVRRTGPEQFELVMGERRWRACPAGRAGHDPGHRPRDRRQRHAARRAAGEPAPVPAQPVGRGLGLRPAARRLLLHPRGARRPDRPLASADQQHAAAAQAQPGGPATGGGGRPLGRPRPVAARRRATPRSRTGWPNGSSPRGSASAASRRSWPSGTPAAPGNESVRRRPTAPGLSELADRLSDRLETRVKVDLGQRKGKITVEFASLDDLRRIVDIMDPRNRSDRPI